jgi:glycosyltransferase involved in cell wall biosynthesis
MKKVSVIIPTKNSSSTLEKCLLSIKNQSYNNVEIIVVDNNSTDNTKGISRKFTNYVFNYGPERSAQRNHGVLQSSGDYVLIIDSDMQLEENVVLDSVKLMNDENILGIVIPEESFGIGFWAQCKKLERSFYVGIPWMEAARFFRKDTFTEIHGYDEENTGTEDYDLPQRIQLKYGKNSISHIDSYIMHDEGDISLIRTCKKKFYYAKRLTKYHAISANQENFKKQSSIIQRYFLFFSNPIKLFKNPIIGIGMLFMKTNEFFFGGLGYLLKKDLELYK